ncbi:fimbrial protein [Stenotrophomonas humi]|uniref:fimbrial protein n=1 Tax=Stenotrophomonas humi TaxID=405444 RepID=UPI000A88C0BB|nr:fimbrial protein [Stenotrophomonas humi]
MTIKNYLASRLLLFLGLCGAGTSAHAQAIKCSIAGGIPQQETFIPNSNIPINPNVALGMPMGEVKGRFSHELKAFTCTGVPEYSLVPMIYEMHRPAVSQFPKVYATGVAGIGMQLTVKSSGGNSYDIVAPDKVKISVPANANTGIYDFRIVLIKTGDIAVDGPISLSLGTFASIRTDPTSGSINNTTWLQFVLGKAITVVPKVTTCTAKLAEMSVPMRPVMTREFTGIGSFSPEDDFRLGLNCGGGGEGSTVAVHVVLTDQVDTNNRSDVLSITSQSSASGVGLQLLKNSTVLRFGPDSKASSADNHWLAGSTGDGEFDIPLTVRYVQTAPQVKPGSVFGRVTFTLSYQ